MNYPPPAAWQAEQGGGGRGNCVGLNIRSEILEYVVEGLILGFFKHVQFAALFINNGTWLDLPRSFFHCGLVLGSSDFDIGFVNPLTLWANHNGLALTHRRNFGRLFALRLRNCNT